MKHFLHSLVRRLSRFAWKDMLFDVSRVEWKYGRDNDGKPINWTEWDNVREHLSESRALRETQELDSSACPSECATGITVIVMPDGKIKTRSRINPGYSRLPITQQNTK